MESQGWSARWRKIPIAPGSGVSGALKIGIWGAREHLAVALYHPCSGLTPCLPDLEPREEQTQASDGAGTPTPQRTWSVFARGWNVLRNALAVGLLVLGSWHPEPWPDHPSQGLPPTPEACAARATQGAASATHQQATTRSMDVRHEQDSS